VASRVVVNELVERSVFTVVELARFFSPSFLAFLFGV
jgi:hypothetical protein